MVANPTIVPLPVLNAGQSAEHPSADQLVRDHLEVARRIASRYRHRGLEAEDLEQVAMLGLTKAAHRFDPASGHDFLSYAVPTIRGEVRRHFRDAGWVVRPPRRIQELQARIATAQAELDLRLGRSARPSEIADHLDVDDSDVVEALAAEGCFAPSSLDVPMGEGMGTRGDLLPSETREQESLEARLLLGPLVRRLDARDRRVLLLRYVEDRSQSEIAAALGLTQPQVSRVLARVLRSLRGDLAGELPAA